uniref:hypothetical protein n=1 Tax=Enterococcus faecium TaxID=1352 RepID=UPI0034E97EA3
MTGGQADPALWPQREAFRVRLRRDCGGLFRTCGLQGHDFADCVAACASEIFVQIVRQTGPTGKSL